MGSELDDLLEQTRALSAQMVSMRDSLAETEVTGFSRDGWVSVTMTVTGQFRSVRVDDTVFRKGREDVEFAVLQALRDAASRLQAITEERVSGLQSMFKQFEE